MWRWEFKKAGGERFGGQGEIKDSSCEPIVSSSSQGMVEEGPVVETGNPRIDSECN